MKYQKKTRYIFTIITLLLGLGVNAFSTGKGKHLFVLSGQSNMARMDPDLSFTPTVQAAFGEENVIVVKSAKGGQPIRKWYKDWKPAEAIKKSKAKLYDKLIKMVQKATNEQKVATVTFIWMQGETDAERGYSAVYADSLQGLHKQLSDDLGRQDVNSSLVA